MQGDEQRVRELLAEVYKPEGVELWLLGRKRSLGGRSPLDLIADGEVARVEVAARALIEGNS